MIRNFRHMPYSVRKGFTLIELLVVIGIIAILIALLFPVFSSIRTRAQERVCANNLKQWGAAMNLHLADHSGKFPSQGSKVDVQAGGAEAYARHSNGWFNVWAPYIGVKSIKDLWEERNMPRPGDTSPFICPSAEQEAALSGDDRSFYCNYPMNLWVEASGRGCSYSESDARFTEFIRIGQIRELSIFPILADGPTGTTDGMPGYEFAITHAYYMGRIGEDEGWGFRHSGKANILFADGHVAGFEHSMIYRDGMDQFWNVGGIQWNPSSSELDGPCKRY